MNIGDLVIYQVPPSLTEQPGKSKSWMGLILGREGTVLRIFWPDIGTIHEFGIGHKEYWETICHREER